MENDTTNKVSASTKFFIFFIFSMVLLALFSAYARFVLAKDYFFLVEGPCNSDKEICYVRDCDDYCPPNELESYQTYRIKAKDFEKCDDNSCSNICTLEAGDNSIACSKIDCDPDNDSCSI